MEKEKTIEFDKLFSQGIKRKTENNLEIAAQSTMPIEAKDFVKQIGNSSILHYIQELNKILNASEKEREDGWKETLLASLFVLISGVIVMFFSGAYISSTIVMLVGWLFLMAKKFYMEQRDVYIRTKIGKLQKPLALSEQKLFYLTIVREKIKDLEPEVKNKILKAGKEYFGFKSFETSYDYTNLPVFLDTKFKEVDLFIEGEISKQNHGLTKEEIEILKD